MIYYYLWSREQSLPIGGPYTSIKRLAPAVKRARSKHRGLYPRRIVQGLWDDLTPTEGEALLTMLDG